MPNRPLRPCGKPGCTVLTDGQYCEAHRKSESYKTDRARGTAHERGYTSRWARYSKAFLAKPENAMCKLELPGCNIFAQCVDHIVAVSGASDPLFWDKSNHQAACLRCNTVKGKKTIVGTGGVKL